MEDDVEFLELLLYFPDFDADLFAKLIKAMIGSAGYPFENALAVLTDKKFTFEQMITDPEMLFALGCNVPGVG